VFHSHPSKENEVCADIDQMKNVSAMLWREKQIFHYKKLLFSFFLSADSKHLLFMIWSWCQCNKTFFEIVTDSGESKPACLSVEKLFWLNSNLRVRSAACPKRYWGTALLVNSR